jgi:hypothetical protein
MVFLHEDVVTEQEPAGELRKGHFKSIRGVPCSGLDCVLVCAGGPGLLSGMALIETTGSRKNGFKREKDEQI